MTKLANFFGQDVESTEELRGKKILRKFFLEFFLEFFKVKIWVPIVICVFGYPNNVGFGRLMAQMKAQTEL